MMRPTGIWEEWVDRNEECRGVGGEEGRHLEKGSESGRSGVGGEGPITPNFLFDPSREIAGIMPRNRCWPTTFLTVTVEDANGWCWKLELTGVIGPSERCGMRRGRLAGGGS